MNVKLLFVLSLFCVASGKIVKLRLKYLPTRAAHFQQPSWKRFICAWVTYEYDMDGETYENSYCSPITHEDSSGEDQKTLGPNDVLTQSNTVVINSMGYAPRDYRPDRLRNAYVKGTELQGCGQVWGRTPLISFNNHPRKKSYNPDVDYCTAEMTCMEVDWQAYDTYDRGRGERLKGSRVWPLNPIVPDGKWKPKMLSDSQMKSTSSRASLSHGNSQFIEGQKPLSQLTDEDLKRFANGPVPQTGVFDDPYLFRQTVGDLDYAKIKTNSFADFSAGRTVGGNTFGDLGVGRGNSQQTIGGNTFSDVGGGRGNSFNDLAGRSQLQGTFSNNQPTQRMSVAYNPNQQMRGGLGSIGFNMRLV